MRLPRNKPEWQWLGVKAAAIGGAALVAWLLVCGCSTVSKPVAQLGGAAEQVSNTVAAVEQPAVEAVKSATWMMTEAATELP